jgi:DNA topoisomerase-3
MREVWLHVAEKPSVAKEVAGVLSGGSCSWTPGPSRTNPRAEFPLRGNIPGVPAGATMIVTSVLGHLMEEDFPPAAKNWETFPLSELFIAPLSKTVKPELKGVEQNLKELANKSTRLVLWLDCDREGENICFEVMAVVQSVRPNIAVSRAIFSALTQRDVLRAMSNLGIPNRLASEAVEARQEMDLRIGAAFTRLQQIGLKPALGVAEAALPKTLTFGPCQLPCLGFVVDRHFAIQNFVKEKFGHVVMLAMDVADTTEGAQRPSETTWHWSRGNIYDLVTAFSLYQAILDAEPNALAVVTSVHQKPKRRFAPPPLATVELQKLASKHLRMSSERCMHVAEQLYQAGFISYPRTETDSYTFTDGELQELARAQTDPRWANYALAIADGTKYHRPRSGGHNDNAHPPIHPTGVYRDQDPEKSSLFELIVRHFLATMSGEAVAADTQVMCTYNDEVFHCGGHTVVEKGWYEIFTYERWNNTTVPNYQLGQTFKPTSLLLKEGTTEPPPYLTEAQLITTMDNHGIGTDATIATHIKTIQDRKYATSVNGTFKPTPLGIALVSAYERVGLRALCKPMLRAQFELGMADIGRGVVGRTEFLRVAAEKYRSLLEKAVQGKQDMIAEMRALFQVAPLDGAAAGGGGRAGENPGDYLPADDQRSVVLKQQLSKCGACGGWLKLEAVGVMPNRAFYATCGPCRLRLRLPQGRFLHDFIPHTHVCPLCRFQCIEAVTENHSFPICPRCVRDPPSMDVMADIESFQLTQEFRCSKCVADCPLAQGMEHIPIKTCTACGQGTLRLKKRSAAGTGGGYFVGCSNYPACQHLVSLPPCTASVRRNSPTCGNCRGKKLTLVFSQLVPLMDPEEEVCIFCDYRLSEYISVKGRGAGAAAAEPAGRSTRPHTAAAAPSTYVLPEVTPARGRGSRGGRGGGRGATRSSSAATTGNAFGGGGGGGGGAPNSLGTKCPCGVLAKELTSKKEATKGGKFLVCGKNPKGCEFYQWLGLPEGAQ